MRRALWIFSAPVVAGGLAWAVNAADNQAPLLTRAPQAQNGKIFYFSRGGKSGAASTASTADDSAADASPDDSDVTDTPPVPQRFVRSQTASGSTAKSPTKNYYKDLFSDSDAPLTSPGAAKAARETAARLHVSHEQGPGLFDDIRSLPHMVRMVVGDQDHGRPLHVV